MKFRKLNHLLAIVFVLASLVAGCSSEQQGNASDSNSPDVGVSSVAVVSNPDPTATRVSLGLFSKPAATRVPTPVAASTRDLPATTRGTSTVSPVGTPTPTPTPQPWRTLSGVNKKTSIFLKNVVESTPILFDGRLLTVSIGIPRGTNLLVNDLNTGEQLAKIPWEYDLASALSVDDKIYVFGSSDHFEPGGHIGMASIDAEYNIGPTTVILPGQTDEKIFNVSVAETPDGYAMVYEIDGPNLTPFSFKFATSKNLTEWSPIGDIAIKNRYAGAPTIRYHEGWFYIIYLRRVAEGYLTSIGRTTDFTEFDWFDGNESLDQFTVLMAPFDFPSEGINNSDVDLVESDGILYFTYANGNQLLWHDLKIATYDGTMGQLFAEFWPDPDVIVDQN